MSERTSAMVNGALIALGALAILDNVVAHIQENTRGITGSFGCWACIARFPTVAPPLSSRSGWSSSASCC